MDNIPIGYNQNGDWIGLKDERFVNWKEIQEDDPKLPPEERKPYDSDDDRMNDFE